MARSLRIVGVAGLLAVPSAATAQKFSEVTIKGGDYAYVTPPKTLSPGLTLFSLDNVGKQRHELVLARLKSGVTPDSAARAMAANSPQGAIEPPNGVLIAPPGVKAEGRLLVDLRPGQTYVLLCNFQDTPQKPHHVTLGMYTSFVVK